MRYFWLPIVTILVLTIQYVLCSDYYVGAVLLFNTDNTTNYLAGIAVFTRV